jgi:hypothetical protein
VRNRLCFVALLFSHNADAFLKTTTQLHHFKKFYSKLSLNTVFWDSGMFICLDMGWLLVVFKGDDHHRRAQAVLSKFQ